MRSPTRVAFRRAAARRRAVPQADHGPATSVGPAIKPLPPISKANAAELDRILDEMDDPTRYLVVSAFTKRFVLYYNVEDNCFAQNRPEGGTAFKTIDVARAVLAALSIGRRKRKDDSLQILTARKTKTGLRILTKPIGLLDRLHHVRRHKIENRKSRIENP
jgi:hypothetical protein